MDENMARLMMSADAAKPMQKWLVTRRTQTRRLRNDMGEWMSAGDTFHGEWILFGWVKMQERARWVKVADCEKINSIDVPDNPPSPTGDVLRWVQGDYKLLNTKYERSRQFTIAGSPQTVNLGCRQNGSVKATDAYISLLVGLNTGMSETQLIKMMNSWTRAPEKWTDSGGRVPTELIFASNTISVIDLSMCGGGLTGIPKGTWIYQVDTLPYDALENYTARTLPKKYIMHYTVTIHGSPIVNPPPIMGGRNGIPVRLPITSRYPVYIRQAITEATINFRNPYYPEWIYT